jgi:hypothetical protein
VVINFAQIAAARFPQPQGQAGVQGHAEQSGHLDASIAVVRRSSDNRISHCGAFLDIAAGGVCRRLADNTGVLPLALPTREPRWMAAGRRTDHCGGKSGAALSDAIAHELHHISFCSKTFDIPLEGNWRLQSQAGMQRRIVVAEDRGRLLWVTLLPPPQKLFRR